MVHVPISNKGFLTYKIDRFESDVEITFWEICSLETEHKTSTNSLILGKHFVVEEAFSLKVLKALKVLNHDDSFVH
jgi:hypothetical protein